ncbi:MAG: SDR family oxidoreductase [Anaerolineae bacterium]
MSGELAGKVAVITGSTRGLGRAMAEMFGREGAAVVVSSRKAEALEQTVAALEALGIRAAGQVCDVSRPEEVQALADFAVKTFGGFDIWVNNAAMSGPYGPTMMLDPAAFTAVVQANILGTYHGSRVALAHFLPKGSGKLVNLLGRGDRGPAPMQNAYGSSKAWVRSFTASLAREYKNSGVGVYAFNPGLVNTDLLRRPLVVEGYESRMDPLRMVIYLWANPPEVPARKALWLVSSATDGKTGLEVRLQGRLQLVLGFLREIGRRITRRQKPPVELDIKVIPAWPEKR